MSNISVNANTNHGKVTVTITDTVVGVDIEGYGTIWVDMYHKDKVPEVYIWGDVNQSDHTHVVSLIDAREIDREEALDE